MKQRILPLLSFFILPGCTLNAQIQKGSILLGGSLGYKSSDYSIASPSSSSNANISPRISYAIGNNSVIGLWGSFNYNKSKSSTSNDKVTNSGYGAGAFWRRYFPIQNRLGWYTELNGGISRTTQRMQLFGGDQKSTSSGWMVGAVPGVYFQALPNLVINANVGGIDYSRSKNKGPAGSISSTYSVFDVNFLSSFNFGVDLILGKKAKG